jgi:hypothetical protein
MDLFWQPSLILLLTGHWTYFGVLRSDKTWNQLSFFNHNAFSHNDYNCIISSTIIATTTSLRRTLPLFPLRMPLL